MREYNKLVRDKIPEIIAAKGEKAEIRVLNESEYVTALNKKLEEEFLEYKADESVEELADILEVIYALARAKGLEIADFEEIRNKKLAERGGFENRYLLERVI